MIVGGTVLSSNGDIFFVALLFLISIYIAMEAFDKDDDNIVAILALGSGLVISSCCLIWGIAMLVVQLIVLIIQ